MTKICPRCKDPHEKPGTYCSRSCANVRTFTEETKKKKSISAKKYYESASPEKLARDTSNATAAWKKLAEERYLTSSFDELSLDMKKRKILEEQNDKCAICGTSTIWRGAPMTLRLDHISGDRRDGSRSNLRLICGNCDSQLPTYCKKFREVNDQELIEAVENTPNTHQALLLVGLQPSKKNYNRVKALIVLTE